MRTLVYGAGPLGSWIAARLHEAGVDVSLLARGQRREDLRSHGVVLEDSRTGAQERHDVPVVAELAADDRYDLVLVVMRKDQSEAILPTLAANQHVGTVVFVQNNAAGFVRDRAALGPDRVMAAFPTAGGERRDPVMRIMPIPQVPMPLGEADGTVTDRTRAVAALLDRMRDKRVQVRDDMDAWLVTHVPLIINHLGVYAADLDAERFARTRDARLLGVRASREALAAQEAAGIPIRPSWFRVLRVMPEPLLVAQLRAMAPTSLYQVGVIAHAAAAREEMLHLLGELGDRLDLERATTPALDRLTAIARGDAPPLPDGSRTEPLRWGGVVAWALGLLAVVGAARALRRR